MEGLKNQHVLASMLAPPRLNTNFAVITPIFLTLFVLFAAAGAAVPPSASPRLSVMARPVSGATVGCSGGVQAAAWR